MFLNLHTHFPVNSGFEIVNGSHAVTESRYFSTGIHPKDSLLKAGEMPRTEALSANSDCLAIGEIGLDKVISVPLDVQLSLFEKQTALAEKLGIPVILHCVKAWNEAMQVRRKLQPKQPWIFHGFRKTALLEQVLKEGLMVSIGTALLYDRKLQEILSLVPDDRLFLETDDDPAHAIREVYEKAAALKKIPVEKLEEIIFSNFTNTFSRFRPAYL